MGNQDYKFSQLIIENVINWNQYNQPICDQVTLLYSLSAVKKTKHQEIEWQQAVNVPLI